MTELRKFKKKDYSQLLIALFLANPDRCELSVSKIFIPSRVNSVFYSYKSGFTRTSCCNKNKTFIIDT
jgi:hypothetical protein